MQFITNRVKTARPKTIEQGGKKWLVVPVVMVAAPEIVMNQELVTFNDLAPSPAMWDGQPVTVEHPRVDGEFVSAKAPGVEHHTIGHITDVTTSDKMRGNMWIDLALAGTLGGDAKRAADLLQAGSMVEVSTAYFRDVEPQAGNLRGNTYHGIARNIKPDHLAILLHEDGACSIADGCGAPRVNTVMTEELSVNLRRRVWTAETAGQWLTENGFDSSNMTTLANTFSFRQALPADFTEFQEDMEPFGFSFEDGVTANFGIERRDDDDGLIERPPRRRIQSIQFFHGAEELETRPAIRTNKGVIMSDQQGVTANEDTENVDETPETVEPPTEPATTETPAVEPTGETAEVEESLDIAAAVREAFEGIFEPLGGIGGMVSAIQGIQANQESERQELITSIEGAPLNPFSSEDLGAMTVNQLRSLSAKLTPANYSGRVGAPLSANTVSSVPMDAALKPMGAQQQKGAND